jgi:multidrug resistance efflux pump
LLFNVALTDKLKVVAKVDEVDVADLLPGMPVDVSVDSQDMPALRGHIAEVSAQATQSGNGLRSAVFDIKIDLPELNAQQRRRLRVGMSCNVSIETGKADFPPTTGVPVSVNRREDGS